MLIVSFDLEDLERSVDLEPGWQQYGALPHDAVMAKIQLAQWRVDLQHVAHR